MANSENANTMLSLSFRNQDGGWVNGLTENLSDEFSDELKKAVGGIVMSRLGEQFQRGGAVKFVGGEGRFEVENDYFADDEVEAVPDDADLGVLVDFDELNRYDSDVYMCGMNIVADSDLVVDAKDAADFDSAVKALEEAAVQEAAVQEAAVQEAAVQEAESSLMSQSAPVLVVRDTSPLAFIGSIGGDSRRAYTETEFSQRLNELLTAQRYGEIAAACRDRKAQEAKQQRKVKRLSDKKKGANAVAHKELDGVDVSSSSFITEKDDVMVGDVKVNSFVEFLAALKMRPFPAAVRECPHERYMEYGDGFVERMSLIGKKVTIKQAKRLLSEYSYVVTGAFKSTDSGYKAEVLFAGFLEFDAWEVFSSKMLMDKEDDIAGRNLFSKGMCLNSRAKNVVPKRSIGIKQEDCFEDIEGVWPFSYVGFYSMVSEERTRVTYKMAKEMAQKSNLWGVMQVCDYSITPQSMAGYIEYSGSKEKAVDMWAQNPYLLLISPSTKY